MPMGYDKSLRIYISGCIFYCKCTSLATADKDPPDLTSRIRHRRRRLGHKTEISARVGQSSDVVTATGLRQYAAMVTVPLLLSMVAYADTTDLAHRVQIHLSAAAQPWLSRQERRIDKLLTDDAVEMIFDLEVNKRGGLTRVRRSMSSGRKPIDRLVHGLFQVIPRLPMAADGGNAAKANIPCVLHVRLVRKPRGLEIDAACFPAGLRPEVATRDNADMNRAIGRLFDGFTREASGDETLAVTAFEAAHEAEPDWYQATLALGLALARSGDLDRARPLLRRAARQRRPTTEVRRFLQAKDDASTRDTGKTEEGDGLTDDAEVSSCERDESEIFMHIRKNLGKLTRCVEAEHKRNPKLEMPDSVPVSFAIGPDGSVRGIAVEHRFYRAGEFNRCVQQALTGRLKPCGGSACPVQFEMDVGASDD
jgi:hypothetical protein